MLLLRKTLLVSFLLPSIIAFGQNSTVNIDELAGKLIEDIRSDKQEKIFAQTDKWYYIAGDNLHFSAYSVNAATHKLSRRNKIVYADLVSDKDTVVSQLLLLNNQQVKLEGNISLPSSLAEGYYWLRIYTEPMLRDHEKNIFVQPVYIFNSTPGTRGPIVTKRMSAIGGDTSVPQITFYPEGGSLISGTTSVVGFRCTDKNGNPVHISGSVRDTWDTVVTTFQTSMPGIGKFSFPVWKSRKYSVRIKWNNRDVVYPLPAVDPFASQISISEQTEEYFKALISLGDSLYKKNKKTYLLVTNRDSLCFAAMGTDMYEVVLPKKNLPSGRNELFLFDEKQQLVSKRDIYVDKNNLNIVIHPEKDKYDAREKVKLDIAVADSSNRPLLSMFSLAVTSDSLIGQSGLNTFRQFANDNIEFPDRDPAQRYTAEQWDMIMLTQKIQYPGLKFGKDQTLVLDGKPEDGTVIKLHGKIFDQKNQPVANRVVTIFSADRSKMIFQSDTTDEQGNYDFALPYFKDSTSFTLQVANLKGVPQKDKIKLDNYNFPTFSTPVAFKERFSPAMEKTLAHFKNSRLDSAIYLQNKEWMIPVTVKRNVKKAPDYDDKKRISTFSTVIGGDKMGSGAKAISNAILTSGAAQLKQGFLVLGGGGPSNLYLSPTAEPLIVVDGATIDQDVVIGQWDGTVNSSPALQYLEQYNANNVDFIEILSGPEAASYGARGGNGVVLLNTRAKIRDNSNEGVAVLTVYPKGYHEAAPFIYPDYDRKELKKSGYLDDRSTIYWNGNIVTDNNGKASVNFFTADTKTSYTVAIEGITAAGELVYSESKINR